MPSYSMRTICENPTDGDDLLTAKAYQIVDHNPAKDIAEHRDTLYSLRTQHTEFVHAQQSDFYNAPNQLVQWEKADLLQEYDESSNISSSESDVSNENDIEQYIVKACTPKEVPGRWRGERVSSAEYAAASSNGILRSSTTWGLQSRNGEEENEDQGEVRRSNDGNDGDENPDPDPDTPTNAGSEFDPTTYYGFLFEEDKAPTQLLDAMLRGIARYIIDNIEPKDVRLLTPAKLAAYYRTVGGNYDSLFIALPPLTISWIYRSIGCQHSLQPAKDNYEGSYISVLQPVKIDWEGPYIPALTERGFVRWQSIEILLGPEEHVPFIQECIDRLGIKHPDKAEYFPRGLPATAFPARPDEAVEKWHEDSALALRRGAYPKPKSSRITKNVKQFLTSMQRFSSLRIRGGKLFLSKSRNLEPVRI